MDESTHRFDPADQPTVPVEREVPAAVDADGSDGAGGTGKFGDLFGGAWVWLAVALIAVAALVIRFAVQPARSDTKAPTTSGVVTTMMQATTSSQPATTSSEPETTSTQPATTDQTVPTSTTTLPFAEPGVFEMPDVVGEGLPSAKDKISDVSSGVVAADVVDASGQGRRQFIDSNWMVCSTSPSTGAKFTVESGVTLRVVKTDETCPEDPDIVGTAYTR